MADNRLLKLKKDGTPALVTTSTGVPELPRDVIVNEIQRCFAHANDQSALLRFSLTSKSSTDMAKAVLFRLSAVNAEPARNDPSADVTKLAVINYLIRDSAALFEEPKQSITDHYGREDGDCLYGILLGAGDVWALRQIHEEIIPLIPNGEEKARGIFLKRFPNYYQDLEPGMDEEARLYDDRNKRQIAAIMKQLAIVKQFIEGDPFTNNQPLDATKQATEALCKLFQPNSGEVIRTGLHFPLAIIKEIYKTYVALQKGWSFFSLAVIKPAVDALSSVDGQCCQHGLSVLDMAKGPRRRCHSFYQHPLGKPLSLMLVNDKDKLGAAVLVDPYDGDVGFRAVGGSFSWFDKNGAALWVQHGRGAGWCRCLDGLLDNLCKTKAETIQRYYATHRREVNTASRSL